MNIIFDSGKPGIKGRAVIDVENKIEELNTASEMCDWLDKVERNIESQSKARNIVILNYKFIN